MILNCQKLVVQQPLQARASEDEFFLRFDLPERTSIKAGKRIMEFNKLLHLKIKPEPMAELMNKGNGRGSARLATPRVDLTAMVDLAFLLITFFMLTTTLAKQNAMPLSLPVPNISGGPVADTRAMTILLDKDDQLIWYRGLADQPAAGPAVSSLSSNGIRAELLRQQKDVLAKTGKGMIVIIKPGDQSRYANLVSILDELSLANIQQHALADPDDKDLSILSKY